MRRYHIQDRDDYKKYNKLCGMVTKVRGSGMCGVCVRARVCVGGCGGAQSGAGDRRAGCGARRPSPAAPLTRPPACQQLVATLKRLDPKDATRIELTEQVGRGGLGMRAGGCEGWGGPPARREPPPLHSAPPHHARACMLQAMAGGVGGGRTHPAATPARPGRLRPA